jgi:hypothetical protein
MGWNHCRTPYNALTAFLIQKAEDTGLFSAETPSQKPVANTYCLDSGYSVFRRARYEAAFFSGLGESYIYSASSRTGVSGLAMLLPKDNKPLTMILNRSLRDNELLATDLPIIEIGKDRFEPIGGTVEAMKDGIRWNYETPLFQFKRTYKFRESEIIVSNSFSPEVAISPVISCAVALPLNTEAYRHVFLEKEYDLDVNACTGNRVLRLEMLSEAIGTSKKLTNWREHPVKSNPRGRGLLLSRDLDLGEMTPITSVKWEYRLILVEGKPL